MSKLKELEKRLRTEPQNFGLRVQVAGLMREAGRSTEAVELYRSVALAYRDQGRTHQAIAVCRSILEIAPDDVACNALLSTLTGSKPSIPSLTPPPSAGGRAVSSPTQPSVGRAPTRPSQGLLRPPTAAPSQPPANRAASPPPVRSRPVSDSVAPAPSRPATPSSSPIANRAATPSSSPVANRAATPSSSPVASRAATPSSSPVANRAATPSTPPPARSRPVSDGVAPAPSRPTTPSTSPIASRPATPSTSPIASRPATPSTSPIASRTTTAGQAPPNQIVRNRPHSASEPPDVSPVPARQPFAAGSEPRGQTPRTGSSAPRTGSQPPRTGSNPPGRLSVVTIPPKTPSQPPRAFTDAGTPAPAPSRPPTAPAPPTHVTGRLPLEPPTRASPPSQPPDTRWSSQESISGGVPKRRSSMEETPLPNPMPHHVHDPTGRNRRVDVEDLETNPQAQRKLKGLTKEEDLARDLDTRPVRRIKSDELEKIDKPPPTVELARIPDEEMEATRIQDSPPNMGEDEQTTPRDLLELDPDTEA